MASNLNLVVTDGLAMNPGDLSWEPLQDLAHVQIYDRTSQDELLARIQHADIIVVNKTQITADTIQACSKLKLICVSATGYNNVDIEAAHQAKVEVRNAAGYSSQSVAQHVFAMLLAYYNRVEYYAEQVRADRWSNAQDFTFADHTIEELSNKKIGVLGLGNIGQAVAKIAFAFGMEVLAVKRNTTSEQIQHINYVGLEEFLKQSEIITVHAPLNESTQDLFNLETFKLMRDDAVLVNTARGPIVNENGLVQALKSNLIRAALLDVMVQEPPEKSRLFGLENCYITPHQAWSSFEARQKLLQIVVSNVQSWQAGGNQNLI